MKYFEILTPSFAKPWERREATSSDGEVQTTHLTDIKRLKIVRQKEHT